MFLLVLAHPGCLGQNPETRKTVVVVVVGVYLLQTGASRCARSKSILNKNQTAQTALSLETY